MFASRVSLLLNSTNLATQSFSPLFKQTLFTPLTLVRLAHNERKVGKPAAAPKKLTATATKPKAPAKKAPAPVKKAAKPSADKVKAQKEKERAQKEKEKERERAQKEKEKEKAQKEKERERAQKEKERERAQKEKERERAQKEKEKEKEKAQKEKEKQLALEKKAEKEKKPKRPLTPYLRFAKEQFPALKQQTPNANISDIAKALGERWKRLSDAEKKKYADAGEKDLDKYRAARAEYDREKQANKKPATGYALYVKENLSKIRSANPSLSVAQAMGEVAKRWKTLSDSQKKNYLKN